MKPVKSFVVKASLPKPLESLRDLVYNIEWYWNTQAIKLLYRLDRKLWDETYHNPVGIIGSISQARLETLVKDEGILSHLERVAEQNQKYLSGATWYSKNYDKSPEKKIAYFSLEFGLAECIPIYSGGLGILAGDHLKSSSDLGLPLVGMGLLYQEGYFRQYLNNDGWQQEQYSNNDFYNMPVLPIIAENGKDLLIEVEFPDGTVYAKVWLIQVGRVPLYLLDTNISENKPNDRKITSSLYGGDQEMRLRQEFLLGIGGIRALHAVNIWPTVFHMNEGHAAFLALERIRELMEEENLTFHEAFELASAGNVFTTHTPVPAGHDRFSSDLMLKYFTHFYPELGLTQEEFLGLGRIKSDNTSETFCLTVLALKSADKSNAVSRLHMHVSKDMWKDLWAGFPVDEIPIWHITNGVHVSSWISHEMVDLFDRYLGPRWKTEPALEEIWARANDIPDEEIWRTHEVRRERLVTFARVRLQVQLKRRGASDSEINYAKGVLNSKALTIGFARRFATYKRADLIFRDLDRLTRILINQDMPVQFIIAGKAHPRDNAGKDIIKKIVKFTNQPELRGCIVFIEDYDMNVARYFMQGVDVWLNNPRRPLEASGTSGMKAAANGALNVSILDGWWDEAYMPEVGWAIGLGEVYDNENYQDDVESNALYNILEKEVVPLFYELGEGRIPRKWIQKMKNTLSMIVPYYNTHRMVHQYFSDCYLPAIERFNRLKAESCARVRTLALWKEHISKHWGEIKIVKIDADGKGPFEVGGSITIKARIQLGELQPDDVSVELYTGGVDADDTLVDAVPFTMKYMKKDGKYCIFEGGIPFEKSGRVGFSLRIVPSHPDMAYHQDCRLITWA